VVGKQGKAITQQASSKLGLLFRPEDEGSTFFRNVVHFFQITRRNIPENIVTAVKISNLTNSITCTTIAFLNTSRVHVHEYPE
jgi:hypothetical protein